MGYELHTIDGQRLLKVIENTAPDSVPEVDITDDIILKTEEYPISALLDQLVEQLSEQFDIKKPNNQILKKVWVYVDFQQPLSEAERDNFEQLLIRGFDLTFSNNEDTVRFVPLLNSANQSKEFIYGFVCQDIYYGMRTRLDLEIDFEGQFDTLAMSYVSKVYAYRALYSSGATPALRYDYHDAESFFNENNIIVLKEPGGKHEATVYTADQKSKPGTNEVALVSAGVTRKKIKMTYLDGAGIISPAGRDFINARLPEEMKGNSFQIRMPFLKGMLHTVDFHQFFRDMGIKPDTEKGEKVLIKDVFGKERDLFSANVIITPSMLKLYSLLRINKKKQNVMTRYFEMMKKYNHGLYVVKTELSFHNTSRVPLNTQLLSTLDLTAEDLDALVAEHIAEADAYCAENLADPDARAELAKSRERDSWMSLLLEKPEFLYDSHIGNMLKNHRVSRYNSIAKGRIRVNGENRFLCGDLVYFLSKILKRLINDHPECEAAYEKISRRFLTKAAVYIPGVDPKTKKVAMLRNPHLSRNEDVCANVGTKGYYYYYKKYLSHLTGVVFTGHFSYIPAALGGADFDGDQIILSYDERIIRACESGYVEGYENEKTLPFINIPALDGKNDVKKHRYVVPQVVYNTFSNRIGIISNATMRIAAVEYDKTLPKSDKTPSAALGTILTGTEIDACKKGLRPDINNVIGYSGKEGEGHTYVAEATAAYIKINKNLKFSSKYKPTITHDKETNLDYVTINKNKITVMPNREHNAVIQLLYRWIKAYENFSHENDKAFEDKSKLCDIFPGAPKENKDVRRILIDLSKVLKEFNARFDTRETVSKIINSNNVKLYMRLKCQYDYIDMDFFDTPSYRCQMGILQKSITKLLEAYPIEEAKALRAALFNYKSLNELNKEDATAKDDFDASTFWPYGMTVEGSQLLADILALDYACLLKNFRNEGYRILFYLLTNAIEAQRVLPPKMPEKSEKDPYASKYFKMAIDAYHENKTKASFEKSIVKTAQNDIFDALDCSNKTDVIQMIYPPKSAAQLETFWKVFSVEDMLEAVGGETYVK